MRVAVFTNEFPSRVSTFFAHDMRGLIDAGIDIEVFSLRAYAEHLWTYVPDGLNERVLPRTKTHHMTLPRALGPSLSSLFSIRRDFLAPAVGATASAATFGLNPLAKTTYAALKACAWARRHQGRFDQVLAYWGNFPATAACLFHHIAAPRTPFSMFLHAGADLYRQRVYMRQKLQYADNVIVTCDFNRRFVLDAYPQLAGTLEPKFHKHGPGIDIDALPFSLERPSTPTVLGVGRLDRLKGFDVLLRAAARLQAEGKRFNVVLIGEGPEAARLKEVARTAGVADRVEFRGWRPFDEVRQAMSEAWILAHPSPVIGDAVPTVIKEAMALGTPVIGANLAGIPELLDGGRCGLLVRPGDADSLAASIDALLSNEAARHTFARSARAFAETHFGFVRNSARLAERLTRLRRPLNGS